MSAHPESLNYAEKGDASPPLTTNNLGIKGADDVEVVEGQRKLHRNLKGRHMQMIAM
jgi:amino acid permease